MAKASKGSAFERLICRKLSLWWSQHNETPEDDMFWRTSGSGARAKTRGRKGQRTYGQGGDIAATHPDADPFMQTFTIEIKRGYSNDTIADLFDLTTDFAQRPFEKWIAQAIESHKQAASLYWALIVRRDRRQSMIYLPEEFIHDMREINDECYLYNPGAHASVLLTTGARKKRQPFFLNCMPLDDFLKHTDPCDIHLLLRTKKKGKGRNL